MADPLVTGANARWEVIWWSRKHKRFIVKSFDNDHASALELFVKVKTAKKPFATLRSCNVAFPPPEKYRPFVKQQVLRETVRIGRKTKVRRRIVETDVMPMQEVNLKGIWWCPYCSQMRKFTKQDGSMFEHNGNEYFVERGAYYCPVCQISHGNHHVRKWNPVAERMPVELKQRRVTKRATRSRTRRSR